MLAYATPAARNTFVVRSDALLGGDQMWPWRHQSLRRATTGSGFLRVLARALSIMPQAPYFREDSNVVRFSVLVDRSFVGASIKVTPHYRFRPGAEGDDALQTYTEHSAAVDAIVRRRVACGAR